MNIFQTLLNKFLNVLQPSVQAAAIRRKQLLADAVEFPLALLKLVKQCR
jgi:hypothetical protein